MPSGERKLPVCVSIELCSGVAKLADARDLKNSARNPDDRQRPYVARTWLVWLNETLCQHVGRCGAMGRVSAHWPHIARYPRGVWRSACDAPRRDRTGTPLPEGNFKFPASANFARGASHHDSAALASSATVTHRTGVPGPRDG